MYYISLQLFGARYWCFKADHNALHIANTAAFADAFDVNEVVHYSFEFKRNYPSIILDVIEADSEKLIPENMRKILNIA